MDSQFNDAVADELYDAAKLISQNRYKKAEPILRDFLNENPLDVNAMRLLADVGIEFRAYKEAGYLLNRALDLAPNYHHARFSYANLLYKRQLPEEALLQIEILLKEEPENMQWLSLKAVNFALANQHEKATELFELIIQKYPANNQIYLSYGHALRAVGKIPEAIAAYKKAISFRRGVGEAYWSLANLKTFVFLDEDIESIKGLLNDKNCNFDDYYHLLFAFGKAFEDKGEYQKSMAAYIKGNQIKSKQVPWKPQQFNQECSNIKNFFTKELFQTLQPCGSEAMDPIFVVGLPRSGSTLIEQILSSHSLIEGTTELQNIIALSRKIGEVDGKNRDSESNYPKKLESIRTKVFKEMGDAYIQNTQSQRIKNTPFFIDKMPNNFIHIGLIQLILPNAKIIDARRNPMDCSFSCYKQLFGSGQGFTYSLNRISNYYLDYLEIMDHWDEALPGKIHRVQYEDMINNTEDEIRKLLDYCGVNFEKDCLNFFNNKRAVRTPSSEQVRQPIYNSSVKHWKNFEPYLGDLKEVFIQNKVKF
ncbi:sulfotransferase [Gammaproteobacteria bacterium]|nr:sulfotransferase [Gammaproteobacteria bacterium]MDB4243135.1 sulfotransferase [Gammaproteobacteria bacterium]MDB9906692.1 sulfotransferase [Gammaproteobacteria bacterium]